MTRDRVRIALVAVAVANVVAVATATTRIFDAPYSPVYAVVAPMLSGLVAVMNPFRRPILRAVPHLIISVGLTALAMRSRNGDLTHDLIRVPVSGLSRVVAARWPAPSEPLSVAAVVLIVALAGAITAELAWVRRYGALLIASPVMLIILVALLAPKAGPMSLGVVVFVVVGSALTLRLAALARTQAENPSAAAGGTSERGANALVGSVIGLVALLPIAIGAPFGDSDRFDVREQRKESTSVAQEISPLSRLDEWRTRTPATTLFSVTPQDPGARWRFVSLTRYDGRAWMPSPDFAPVGEVLSSATGSAPIERFTVEIDDYLEAWAPFAGVPLKTNLDARVDGSLSGIRLPNRLQTGDRFEIEIIEPTPSPAVLKTLGADPDVELAPIVGALGEDAEAFVSFANQIVANESTDYDRAAALASALSRDYRLSDDAPAGHSLPQLRVFLTSSKAGRDEQFVAIYAILARLIGLPARVAVGVDLTADGSSSLGSSENVTAWPEIAFAGVGWVPFDPVPTQIAEEEARTESEELAGSSGQIAPPPTTAPRQTQPDTTLPGLDGTSGTALSVGGRLVIAGGLLALALLAYVVTVITMKRNRRKRREQSERSDVRIAGAFLTAVERAVDLGAEAGPTYTNRELVRSSTSVVGGNDVPLHDLASLATRAVYDRQIPSESAAKLAWDESQRANTEMVRAVGRVRWVRALVSLKSLRLGPLEALEDDVPPRRRSPQQ